MEPARARPDPETLLANAGWLHALARSLVADDARAGDVVQQTFAAAVEHPPGGDVPLRPWLARVARNFALKTRRAESRRARHEAQAPSLARDPSPVETVARAETFREVVDAVLALEPIYRDVVLLRFFDGLDIADAARALEVPVETARTRLKRALAMLRERLDRKYGDRRAWALLLAAPRGATKPAATSTAAAAATAVAGGLLMANKIATAAAAAVLVALLAGGGWYAFGRGGAAKPESPATVASAAPGARSPAARAKTDAAQETPPAADTAATSTSSSVRWLLRGHLDAFAPRGTARAEISAYPVYEQMERIPEPLHVQAGADGRFEFDVSAALRASPRPTVFFVVADHPDFLTAMSEAHVPADGTADATGAVVFECAIAIPMRPAAILSLRVVDADGNPLPGAHAGSFGVHERMPDERPVDHADTDASGVARLRLVPGEEHLVLAVAAGREPATKQIVGGAADSATLQLREGAAISGCVTEDGHPVADAEVRVTSDVCDSRDLGVRGDIGVSWRDGAVYATELRAKTDAQGRYRVTGLPRETCRVAVRRAAGRDLTGFERTADAPEGRVDIDIAAAKLAVRVTCDGAPVKGVLLHGLGGESVPKTDADGRAEIAVAPGRRFQIETMETDYARTTDQIEAPAAGRTATHDIALVRNAPHGSVVITVKSPDGRAIEYAGLAFFGPESSYWFPEERFGDASDRFVVDDIAAGRWRLVVRPGRHWQPDFTWDGDMGTWLDETIEIDVPATGEKHIDIVSRPGGRLRIAARDAKGRLLAAKCVVRDAEGREPSTHFAARYGRGGAHSMGERHLDNDAPSDLAEAVPPGRYRIEVSLEGYETRTVDADVVAGKTCAVDIALQGDGPDPERGRPVAVPATSPK